MNKKFSDFELKSSISSLHIVGYDTETQEEIKIPAQALVQPGKPGDSLKVEYSVNGESWHIIHEEDDQYMRQKVGSGEWTNAILINSRSEQEAINEIKALLPRKPLPVNIRPVAIGIDEEYGLPTFGGYDVEYSGFIDIDVSQPNLASANLQHAFDICQVVEEGMEEVGNMYQRIHELTYQILYQPTENYEISAINDEVVDLINEIEGIFKTLEYDGKILYTTDWNSEERGTSFVIRIFDSTKDESNYDRYYDEFVISSEFLPGEVFAMNDRIKELFVQLMDDVNDKTPLGDEILTLLNEIRNISYRTIRMEAVACQNLLEHLRWFFDSITVSTADEEYEIYTSICRWMQYRITELKMQLNRYRDMGDAAGYAIWYDHYKTEIRYLCTFGINTLIAMYYNKVVFDRTI
jgi:hypothetical protein